MASEGAPIDVDEADPIKATYEVFIKPQMQSGQQLYILQFPNRPANEDYSSKNHALPLEVRLKPKTKLIEVDVPLDVWQNYDREKGARWGESMRKSNGKNAGTAGGGHSQGLAGGFGIGGQAAPSRRRAADDGDVMAESQIMKEFPMGVTQQRVLTKQTLGGQAIPREAATPQYFIGAFRKSVFLYFSA
jgi:DNA-directed RNA polymerase-3 subunit RPC5